LEIRGRHGITDIIINELKVSRQLFEKNRREFNNPYFLSGKHWRTKGKLHLNKFPVLNHVSAKQPLFVQYPYYWLDWDQGMCC